MQTPNLDFTLAGAILPQIGYTDLNGNAQTLVWRMPPTKVSPVSPVPGLRTDNVAADGTMWSTTFYTEAYISMTTTILIGTDLQNWMNFLSAAINGQVMQFFPDQTVDTSYPLRLMVQTNNSSSNSNIPTCDPTPKLVGTGRFQSQLVFRYENVPDAITVFQALNNWS
jgi:hypothetical protein